MANQDIKDDEKTKSKEVDPFIFKTPLQDLVDKIKIPDVSLPEFLFNLVEINYEVLKDKVWVMDIIKEKSYKYSDIKPISTKFASAITRMGFKRGDVLYFVTYDMALIFIIEIAVWMCGGAVRGCFQREDKEEFLRQMDEVSSRFILCDPETSKPVKWAAEHLSWPVKLLSIGGKVEGATAVEDMIENDDGSAFPHDLKINPKEDLISFPNTSGSTGVPKGATHTHYNLVAFGSATGAPTKLENRKRPLGNSLMASIGNFAVGALINLCWSIAFGYSYLNISKFDQKTYLNFVLKYKPETLFLYPHNAYWFARAIESGLHDFSFVTKIFCSGSVLDIGTSKMLAKKLPQIKIMQGFGMSESFMVAASVYGPTSMDSKQGEERVAGLKIKSLNNELHMSCGPLLPLTEAKIMDTVNGRTVGPNVKGTFWFRAPYLMKGYVNRNAEKGYVSVFDEDGWFDSGDVAFIDEDGYLYIVERESSIFKYYMHQISPAELEAVIGEHPAVLTVGVVGVPDPVTNAVARAYVVLKPNCKATEEEIKQYVAERKIFYKQLHGGVVFVDRLPESRGGKLDRQALLRKAIAESQSTPGADLKKTHS